MGIDALAFCFGGLLLFVAMIGGGVEVKEIKLPHLTWLPRTAFAAIGGLFILLGLGLQQMVHPKQDESTSAATRTQVAPMQDSPVAAAPIVPVKLEPSNAGARLVQGFSGLHARALVTWSAQGVAYVAQLQLQGERGIGDVQYSATDGLASVRQDLLLQPNSAGWLYVGFNPRDAETGESLVGSYAPDTFRLARLEDGTWTLSDTCDTQGLCSPVRVQPL